MYMQKTENKKEKVNKKKVRQSGEGRESLLTTSTFLFLHVLLVLVQCNHSALLESESLLLALVVVEHASSEKGSEGEELEADTSPEHVLGKLTASCPDPVTCSGERCNRQTHTCRSSV